MTLGPLWLLTLPVSWLKSRLMGAVGALLLTVPLLVGLLGFSVDDAWIVRRVAQRGAAGEGFSFNPADPTDAVTPLGFARLVGLLSAIGQLDPFLVARGLGTLSLIVALAIAGAEAFSSTPGVVDPLRPVSRSGRLAVWGGTVATCAPLGAWASAGLATGLVTLLVAGGCASLERPPSPGVRWMGMTLLGLAGALRPELLPFCVAFAVERSLGSRASSTPKDGLKTASTVLDPRGAGDGVRRRAFCAVALVFVPVLLWMAVRWSLFGTVIPLSAVAKAPDLGLGIRYALGGALFCGPLVLLWTHLFGASRRRVIPFLVHGGAVALAGGDWMPFYRLWVPVLPWAAALAIRELEVLRFRVLPAVGGLAVNLLLLFAWGADARRVVQRRNEMIATAAPFLSGQKVVATVDVGWVGAATRGTVVDLAGVTDPRVAALPGGHTSKKISPGFFSDQNVQAWVVRARDDSYSPGDPPASIAASYVVDARLLRRCENLGFVGIATVPLEGTPGQYVILVHEEHRNP